MGYSVCIDSKTIHHQFQVIFKDDYSQYSVQDLYLESLKYIGVDFKKNDIRFIKDNWKNPSVGASGAIFGLFGAMVVVGKKIGADIRSIAVIIGINFALGFALGGVDWHAHLGGLIGGTLASVLLLTKKR